MGTGPPARKARPGRHSLLPSLDSAERIACAVTAGSARGQFVSQARECRQDAPLPRCPGGWDQRGCVFSGLGVSCGSSKENWKWEETGPRLRRLHALHRHKREPRTRWGGAGPGLQWWLLLPRLSVTPCPSAHSFTVRPVSADSAPGTVSRGCGGEQSLREAQPRGNASWDSSVRLSGARSSALSVGRLLRQTSDHPIEAPAFGTLPLPRLYGRQTASCCEISSLDYFSVSAWPLKGKPHGAGTLSYSLLYLVPEY